MAAGEDFAVVTKSGGTVVLPDVAAGEGGELAAKADMEPLLLAQYYPDGSVTSASEFTSGIKYTFDAQTHTATVKPFCNTGNSNNDNSSLAGRVVIPPFVDAQGNPHVSDDGTKFKVTEVAGGEVAGEQGVLTAIVAPDTVESVREYAFFKCTALASVSLPAATSVGNGVFDSCFSLASVSLPAATGVGSGAFVDCVSLASVSLPSATSVREYAFFNCTALASVSLPAATGVMDNAFNGCTSLASVDFGASQRSSVPTLGSDAFLDVSTTCKIVVPDSQYNDWIAASGWSARYEDGFKFLKHSEWEYARRYELGGFLDSRNVVDSLRGDSSGDIEWVDGNEKTTLDLANMTDGGVRRCLAAIIQSCGLSVNV